jgi:fatty-acyl-CoA synthase
MLKTSYWPAEPGDVRDVTVGQLLRHAAETVPDRLALVDCVADPAARRSWTYAEFLADAVRGAQALLARFEPGDRIAVWAPNSADWIVLQQAVSLAGMVLVALNPAYRQRELGYVLGQSGARALFCPDEFRGFDMRGLAQQVRPQTPDLETVLSLADFENFLASADAATPLPEVRPGDVLQLQYTSGTTGFPKGAVLHHRGLVNEATFVAERADFGDGDVYVNAMPMYHIGGGAVTSFGAWAKRGTFVILAAFDPASTLEAFEAYRGTHSLVVPTMLISMLDHPDSATRDLASIKTILSGAASVPAALVRRTTKQLGCGFSILFGQTEMHGVVTQTRTTDSPEDQAETVGRPLPQLEVKIADPLTGEPVPCGERGEICARGYQNMIEYYEMPEATAATIDAGGWLHMGDIGSMDERGFVRVTSRIKDMILRGGMNLYPAEIEAVLLDHPAIETAAVIGVPDEHWGEQVGAVLRLRAGHPRPTVAELTEFVRGQIAPHKTPVYWTFVDQLPMTSTGKTQKYVLREQVAAGTLVFDEVRTSSVR